jgi:hypothetical protein
MLTGDLRNKVDRVWEAFWIEDIASPIITFLSAI